MLEKLTSKHHIFSMPAQKGHINNHKRQQKAKKQCSLLLQMRFYGKICEICGFNCQLLSGSQQAAKGEKRCQRHVWLPSIKQLQRRRSVRRARQRHNNILHIMPLDQQGFGGRHWALLDWFIPFLLVSGKTVSSKDYSFPVEIDSFWQKLLLSGTCQKLLVVSGIFWQFPKKRKCSGWHSTLKIFMSKQSITPKKQTD